MVDHEAGLGATLRKLTSQRAGGVVGLPGDAEWRSGCSRSGRRICKGREVGKWPGVQRARVAGRSLWRQAGTGTHGLVSSGERHMDGKPGAIATDESRQEETQSDWYSAGGGISRIVERWSPQDFLVTRCRSREMVDLSTTYGNKHNGWKSRTRQGGKGSGKTSCIQKVLNTCLYINRHSTICSVQQVFNINSSGRYLYLLYSAGTQQVLTTQVVSTWHSGCKQAVFWACCSILQGFST